MVKIREIHSRLPDGSIDLKNWLSKIAHGRTERESDLIKHACNLAKEYGENVAVIPHEPGSCYEQGLTTAEILTDLGLDAESLAAAIVYYSHVAAKLSLIRIKNELGVNVAGLISGLLQIDNIHASNPFHVDNLETRAQSLNNLRKMLLAVVEDIRVVLIKISIHVCNMRFACHQALAIRTKLAMEAREIYGPLANRLGIGQLKWELEDLSFRFLEPATYKSIATKLDERRIDREAFVADIVTTLAEALKREGIAAELSGRAKHIFSIWRKMQRKMVSYNEIYDIRAIRVLVDEITDCYAALGVVHTLWQHIPKEFDDYIACPKANGYKSLHTAVVGPDGKVMEIQIRTKTMHKQSELGVAAHWRYKEGSKRDVEYEEKLNSLRQLLNWQEEIRNEGSNTEDIDADDALKIDLVEDRIYVFTPKGEVVDLPKGATALDFAYHIHTDIGHRCRGAKVNGKIVPLTKPLSSGVKVEIITVKEGGPSRDWINSHFKYLVTTKAKAKVQQWFKKLDNPQNIQHGLDIIHREFKRLNVDKLDLKDLAAHIAHCTSEEELLAGLGSGNIKVAQLLGAIQRMNSPLQLAKPALALNAPQKIKKTEITVGGVGNLICHMARCCHPIPGDEIIGYITLGEGISVHRKDCINILQIKENKLSRLVEVNWGGKIHNPYEVVVVIKVYNRQELLKEVFSILAAEAVDVLNINTAVLKNTHITKFRLNLAVPSLEVLGRVLSRLQQIPNIIEVYRDK